MSDVKSGSGNQPAVVLEPTTEKDDSVCACPLCGSTRVSDFLSSPDRFHLRRENYDLLRCSSCLGVWLTKPPKPQEMPFHYSRNYHQAIVTGAAHTGERRWQSHRDVIARYKQGGSILDVGCSAGSFLASLDDQHWKRYGIEMDQLTAQAARLNSGADVFAGDVMDAPYGPNSFDVVTCFDVLEHMYQPREFLERVLHWMRPGGLFFARVPNIDSWESRVFGKYWYGLELPRHLYHFSPRSMKPFVTALGFRVVAIKATMQGTHFGHSLRYVFGDLLQRFGFSPVAMAEGRKPSLAWRAVRKALWLSLIAPLSRIPSAANAGVIVDVILKKQDAIERE